MAILLRGQRNPLVLLRDYPPHPYSACLWHAQESLPKLRVNVSGKKHRSPPLHAVVRKRKACSRSTYFARQSDCCNRCECSHVALTQKITATAQSLGHCASGDVTWGARHHDASRRICRSPTPRLGFSIYSSIHPFFSKQQTSIVAEAVVILNRLAQFNSHRVACCTMCWEPQGATL